MPLVYTLPSVRYDQGHPGRRFRDAVLPHRNPAPPPRVSPQSRGDHPSRDGRFPTVNRVAPTSSSSVELLSNLIAKHTRIVLDGLRNNTVALFDYHGELVGKGDLIGRDSAASKRAKSAVATEALRRAKLEMEEQMRAEAGAQGFYPEDGVGEFGGQGHEGGEEDPHAGMGMSEEETAAFRDGYSQACPSSVLSGRYASSQVGGSVPASPWVEGGASGSDHLSTTGAPYDAVVPSFAFQSPLENITGAAAQELDVAPAGEDFGDTSPHINAQDDYRIAEASPHQEEQDPSDSFLRMQNASDCQEPPPDGEFPKEWYGSQEPEGTLPKHVYTSNMGQEPAEMAYLHHQQTIEMRFERFTVDRSLQRGYDTHHRLHPDFSNASLPTSPSSSSPHLTKKPSKAEMARLLKAEKARLKEEKQAQERSEKERLKLKKEEKMWEKERARAEREERKDKAAAVAPLGRNTVTFGNYSPQPTVVPSFHPNRVAPPRQGSPSHLTPDVITLPYLLFATSSTSPPIRALIDSGAMLNLIHPHIRQRLNLPYRAATGQVNGVTGASSCLGICEGPDGLGVSLTLVSPPQGGYSGHTGSKCRARLVVGPAGGTADAILGMPWIVATRAEVRYIAGEGVKVSFDAEGGKRVTVVATGEEEVRRGSYWMANGPGASGHLVKAEVAAAVAAAELDRQKKPEVVAPFGGARMERKTAMSSSKGPLGLGATTFAPGARHRQLLAADVGWMR